MCEKRNIEISPIEMKIPSLLHSKLGAALAKEKFGIKVPSVI